MPRHAASRPRESRPTPFQNYLSKPTPLEVRLASIQDSHRIVELEGELENRVENNVNLKMEIRQLRDILARASNR